MFSKGSGRSREREHQPKGEAPKLKSEAPTNAVRRQGPLPQAEVGVPSIISADLSIVGELKSSGDIQIDGTVEGSVSSRVVTVGGPGVVRGTVIAQTARVHGTVEGEIEADSVVVSKSARINGDVLHGSLSIEAGASIAGKVSRLERAREVRNASIVRPTSGRPTDLVEPGPAPAPEAEEN